MHTDYSACKLNVVTSQQVQLITSDQWSDSLATATPSEHSSSAHPTLCDPVSVKLRPSKAVLESIDAPMIVQTTLVDTSLSWHGTQQQRADAAKQSIAALMLTLRSKLTETLSKSVDSPRDQEVRMAP